MITNLISAKMNGNTVYGKIVGGYELYIDTAPCYYPGWVPDCEIIYYRAMELIDGTLVAVADIFGDGKSFEAHIPHDDYLFYRYYDENKRLKRGRHCNSNNRKANRMRIMEAEPLPF